MRHLPSRNINYWTTEKWLCDGDIHEHLTRAAAARCEAKGDIIVYGGRGPRARINGERVSPTDFRAVYGQRSASTPVPAERSE